MGQTGTPTQLKVAAKAIFIHDGEVLVVGDPDGVWDFPGGGIENDEHLEAALRREIKEELGWEGFQIGKLVHVDEWFIEKKALHVVAIFYRIDITERQSHTLSSEHGDAAWVSPAEVRKRNVTGDTIRALEAMGL